MSVSGLSVDKNTIINKSELIRRYIVDVTNNKTYFKSSSLPDERHWADGHDGDDRDQRKSGRVGPTSNEAENSWMSGEQPLAGVPSFASVIANLNPN